MKYNMKYNEMGIHKIMSLAITASKLLSSSGKSSPQRYKESQYITALISI